MNKEKTLKIIETRISDLDALIKIAHRMSHRKIMLKCGSLQGMNWY